MSKDTSDKIRELIKEYSLDEQIKLTASAKRYYPYSKLASHGHFGRLDLDLPWERLDYVDTLKKYLNK